MKTLVKLLTVCLLVSFIAGCVAPATPMPAATEAPKPADTPVPEPALTEAEAWLRAAELGKYAPAQQNCAAIQAAAKKEGKVLVYATLLVLRRRPHCGKRNIQTSPLEGYDLGGDEAVVKVREEEKGCSSHSSTSNSALPQ